FSPGDVIAEFSSLLKTYRITKVKGDRYAGEFPRELYRKQGIEYRCADKTKSDLYRDMLPLLNAGRITLPKSERLVQQLCGLERRVERAAKDSADQGSSAEDAWAKAFAGAANHVSEHRINPPAQQSRWGYRQRQNRHKWDGPLEGGGHATAR